jgi:hypothetical protein
VEFDETAGESTGLLRHVQGRRRESFRRATVALPSVPSYVKGELRQGANGIF